MIDWLVLKSVSMISLFRSSCHAKLLAQVAKSGRRKCNAHAVVGHLPMISAREYDEPDQATCSVHIVISRSHLGLTSSRAVYNVLYPQNGLGQQQDTNKRLYRALPTSTSSSEVFTASVITNQKLSRQTDSAAPFELANHSRASRILIRI